LTREEKRVPVKVSRTPGGADSRKTASGDVGSPEESLEDNLGRLESAPAIFAGPALASGHRPSFVAEISRVYTDLFDTGNEYRVLAELPGVEKEGLDITVSARDVKIRVGGTDEVCGEPRHRQRGKKDSKILRTVALPEEAMAERAEANLNNGVLEVKVPKRRPTDGSKHWTLTR
jgi:HSP20 family molecular chaperone IbpA